MIIALILAISLTYAVARGMHSGSSDSEDYVRRLLDRKHNVEIVIPVKIDPLENKNILNILDYMEEKKFEKKTDLMLEELGVSVEK
jgi:hypothetical protein